MGRRKQARPRPQRGRKRRLVFVALGIGVAACLAVVAALALVLARGPTGPKAAIVDQLSLTEPNPAFAEETTAVLRDAGYDVDYYPGEKVTVDFYRNLPSHGYDLIVLRNHSARRPDSALFTSEVYDPGKYVDEQNDLRLVKVSYPSGGDIYFGVRSDFITTSMKGRFDGTTIVLMGCNGLTTSRTAEAFVEKGAKAVVGWSELVSADHTDEATEHLLQHLVADGEDADEAVAEAMQRASPSLGAGRHGGEERATPTEAATTST
jgi:uncharacterized membrane protein